MGSFTDSTGRRWPFEIDFPALARVERLLGVDLAALSAAEVLRRLRSPVFLVNLLYCLCKPEVDEAGLSDTEFGRRCAVPLEPVLDELIREHSLFCQRLGPHHVQQSRNLMTSWMIARMTDQSQQEAAGSVLDVMEQWLSQRISASESGGKSTGTPLSQEESVSTNAA